MKTDVQNWINNPSTNFGWLIKGIEGADLRKATMFYSRESANKPTLTVYYPPVGARLCLAPSILTGSTCRDSCNKVEPCCNKGHLAEMQSSVENSVPHLHRHLVEMRHLSA